MSIIHITAFAPHSGFAGTVISFTLPSGDIPEPPNSLHPLPCTFTPIHGGPSVREGTLIINDPQTYTSFSLQVPHETPQGEYIFSSGLYNDAGKQYTMESDTPFTVEKNVDPVIETFIPARISQTDFPTANFRITGENLTKINYSRHVILRPNNITLLIMGGTDTYLTLRPLRDTQPPTGTYLPVAYTQDGGSVIANARLRVTKGRADENNEGSDC